MENVGTYADYASITTFATGGVDIGKNKVLLIR